MQGQRIPATPHSALRTLRLCVSAREKHVPATPHSALRTPHFSRGFTLLELIVVIGILAVLLAIVLPIPRLVRTAALKKQAKVEATALAQAAIRYKSEYGFWPGEVVCTGPGQPVEFHPDLSGDQIFGVIVSGPREFTQHISSKGNSSLDILRLSTNEVYRAFSTVGYPSGKGYDVNLLNPKAIPFLELTNETDIESVCFPDPFKNPQNPWGQPYRLVMGLNPRSRFEFSVYRNNDPSDVIYEAAVSNVTAFAFSVGPGGRGNTNYIFSAGVGL